MRGEPSLDLALTSFVSFLQNHDQVGNRAMGERIVELGEERAIRAAMSVMLLSPEPPLLFMGEEFGAQTPFLFFCDFGPELAAAVTEGRRSEFARFERFSDPSAREKIPDPSDIGEHSLWQADIKMGEPQIKNIEASTPLRRRSQAVDIAWTVVFLASQQARQLTGQVLSVSGGFHMPR